MSLYPFVNRSFVYIIINFLLRHVVLKTTSDVIITHEVHRNNEKLINFLIFYISAKNGRTSEQNHVK